jgi:hypothetical protein
MDYVRRARVYVCEREEVDLPILVACLCEFSATTHNVVKVIQEQRTSDERRSKVCILEILKVDTMRCLGERSSQRRWRRESNEG